MSAARDAIAAALDSVDGLAGYAYPPPVAGPGAAWPQWVGAELTHTLAGPVLAADEWDVLIVLAAGDGDATGEDLDAVLPAACAAVAGLGRLDRVDAAAVQVADGATVPAIRLRLTTERP